jgi:23S rRNA pseudouridine1911/1915/1917 synthase
VAHPLLGTVFAAAPGGKESVSHCRVVRSDEEEGTSLLEVRIPTGRPHQIRIHCAAVGHPLVGDPLYEAGGLPVQPQEGRMAVPGDCGYLLHSWKIIFPDPATAEPRHVTVAPPDILLP